MRSWRFAYRYSPPKWAWTFSLDGTDYSITPALKSVAAHVETVRNLLPDQRSAPEVSTEVKTVRFRESDGAEVARLLAAVIMSYEGTEMLVEEIK